MQKFTHNYRVYYEDTDAQGVVYNGRYLNFMSRARIEWVRSLGFLDRLTSKESFLVLRHVEIDYLKPARFNDLLQISCEIEKIGHSSLVLKHEIRDAEDSDKLYIVALATLVNLNAEFKPKRLDEEFLSKIK